MNVIYLHSFCLHSLLLSWVAGEIASPLLRKEIKATKTASLMMDTLIVLTISNSAVVRKLTPSFLRSSLRYLVTSLPATSTLMMLCGIAKPS